MAFMDNWPSSEKGAGGKDNKPTPIRRSPLQIVDWEFGCDLRDYGWAAETVDEVVRQYKLKHRQAVVFFNNSKMFGGSGSHPPKCRIYWMWNGQAMTLIPPVRRSGAQVDFQHDLNRWIREHFGEAKGLGEFLDEYTERYTSSSERRRAAKKAGKKLELDWAI